MTEFPTLNPRSRRRPSINHSRPSLSRDLVVVVGAKVSSPRDCDVVCDASVSPDSCFSAPRNIVSPVLLLCCKLQLYFLETASFAPMRHGRPALPIPSLISLSLSLFGLSDPSVLHPPPFSNCRISGKIALEDGSECRIGSPPSSKLPRIFFKRQNFFSPIISIA